MEQNCGIRISADAALFLNLYFHGDITQMQRIEKIDYLAIPVMAPSLHPNGLPLYFYQTEPLLTDAEKKERQELFDTYLGLDLTTYQEGPYLITTAKNTCFVDEYNADPYFVLTSSDAERYLLYTLNISSCVAVLMVSRDSSPTKAALLLSDTGTSPQVLHQMKSYFANGAEIYLYGGNDFPASIEAQRLFLKETRKIVTSDDNFSLRLCKFGFENHTGSIGFNTKTREIITNGQILNGFKEESMFPKWDPNFFARPARPNAIKAEVPAASIKPGT